MSPLLHVSNISKRFGGFVALDGIELEVQPGERLGLIGPNGSGKSTLVNCICGALQNEQGSVHFDGHAVDGLAAHERTHRGLARSSERGAVVAMVYVPSRTRYEVRVFHKDKIVSELHGVGTADRPEVILDDR